MTCFSTCYNKTPYAYTPNLLQTSMSCAPTQDRKRWPCVSVLFWTLITTLLRLQVKRYKAWHIQASANCFSFLANSLIFDVCTYRKPQVLRPCPGCLHHALLSSGKLTVNRNLRVHLRALSPSLNAAVLVFAGPWHRQRYDHVREKHHEYRNQQCHRQSRILSVHKSFHVATSLAVKNRTTGQLFILRNKLDGFCRKRRDHFRRKLPWRVSSKGNDLFALHLFQGCEYPSILSCFFSRRH